MQIVIRYQNSSLAILCCRLKARVAWLSLCSTRGLSAIVLGFVPQRQATLTRQHNIDAVLARLPCTESVICNIVDNGQLYRTE